MDKIAHEIALQFSAIPEEPSELDICLCQVIEGLKKMVGSKDNIPKIIVAKAKKEVNDAKKEYEPIIAFSGPYKLKKEKIPYADGLKNSKKLADIVVSWLKKAKA